MTKVELNSTLTRVSVCCRNGLKMFTLNCSEKVAGCKIYHLRHIIPAQTKRYCFQSSGEISFSDKIFNHDSSINLTPEVLPAQFTLQLLHLPLVLVHAVPVGVLQQAELLDQVLIIRLVLLGPFI